MFDRQSTRTQAKKCEGEEGAAILETAMSSIILLIFIFGVMETGFGALSYHFISERRGRGLVMRSLGVYRGSQHVTYSYSCIASTGKFRATYRISGSLE